MAVLSVKNVTKSYNDFKAVDQISFQAEEGRILGLLGPNGAGKTTTIRMIMNIIIPDSGNISIFGEKFVDRYKNLIGYLPEERGLYPRMTALDQLQFLGEMKGMKAGVARQKSLEWLNRCKLGDAKDKKVENLSKGMSQKVQFLGAILHCPKLLIMDEPFSGLDPINTNFLKDIVLELKQQGVTIIFSTHMMDQAERLCDHIGLINKGKLVLYGDLQDIKKKYSHNSVTLGHKGDGSFLKDLDIVKAINNYSNYTEIRLKDGISTKQLLKILAEKDIEINKFETFKTTLNNIFIDVVQEGQNE